MLSLILQSVALAINVHFYDYNEFSDRRAKLCQWLGPYVTANTIFLTAQASILLPAYFLLEKIGFATQMFAPLVFAMGMFVTIFYFLLVRGTNSWKENCNTLAKKVKHDFVHIVPALTSFLHVFWNKKYVSFQHAHMVTILFMIQYLALIHVNFYKTDDWPYDVFQVGTKKRLQLCAGLSLIFMIFTEIGRNLLMY